MLARCFSTPWWALLRLVTALVVMSSGQECINASFSGGACALPSPRGNTLLQKSAMSDRLVAEENSVEAMCEHLPQYDNKACVGSGSLTPVAGDQHGKATQQEAVDACKTHCAITPLCGGFNVVGTDCNLKTGAICASSVVWQGGVNYICNEAFTLSLPGLKNSGRGCWSGCGGRPGVCAYCGSGACCRPGWRRDPAECKTAVFAKRWGGHRCVSVKVDPTPPPTPQPTWMPGLKNNGRDCWRSCRRGGVCAYCGSGACCRPGWRRDPAECKTAVFAKRSGGHRCVSVLVTTPSPTAVPVDLTPSPTTPPTATPTVDPSPSPTTPPTGPATNPTPSPTPASTDSPSCRYYNSCNFCSRSDIKKLCPAMCSATRTTDDKCCQQAPAHPGARRAFARVYCSGPILTSCPVTCKDVNAMKEKSAKGTKEKKGKKANKAKKTAWMPTQSDCDWGVVATHNGKDVNRIIGSSGCLKKCTELSNVPGCAMQCTKVCFVKSAEHQKQEAMIKHFGDGMEAWLASTNWYRCMHDSPPVVWSKDLEKWAQVWADTVLAQSMEHYGELSSDTATAGKSMYKMEVGTATEHGCFGENMASGYGTPFGSVRAWYSEYENCVQEVGCREGKQTRASGGSRTKVGHFTTMIWKAATQIGCAQAGEYHVCRYRVENGKCAAPNKGDFESNVQARTTKSTMEQCQAKQGFVWEPVTVVLPDCVCKADSPCRSPPRGNGKFCYVEEKCNSALPSSSSGWLSYDACKDGSEGETFAERDARFAAMNNTEVKEHCSTTYQNEEGQHVPRDVSPEFCAENSNDPFTCCRVTEVKPCGKIPLRCYCGESCSDWDAGACKEFDKTKEKHFVPTACRRRRAEHRDYEC